MSTPQPPRAGSRAGYTAARPYIFSMAKLLVLGLGQISGTYAAPLLSLLPFKILAEEEGEEPPMSPDKPTLWIYLAVAVALVLLGGAFAGLTIALMGQVSSCSVLSLEKNWGRRWGCLLANVLCWGGLG